MKRENIIIDKLYEARSELLVEPFIGMVVVKLSNAVVMTITNHADVDKFNAIELDHVIAVRCADVQEVSQKKMLTARMPLRNREVNVRLARLKYLLN